jgi:hypothetical protein
MELTVREASYREEKGATPLILPIYEHFLADGAVGNGE